MKRREFLRNAANLGLAATGAAALPPLEAATVTGPIDHVGSSMVVRVRNAALALQRKDWEHGSLAQAFLEMEDWPRLILMAKAAAVLCTPDGREAVVSDGSPTDPAMGGEAYWKAAQLTQDSALTVAVNGMLNWILTGAPRSADGTLSHVFNHMQMWSDGFNGAAPFLAAMGHYDEALRQVEGYKRRLWNPEKMLLAHIAEEDAAGNVTLAKPVEYFGTGMGWAAAGLVRILRQLPASYARQRTDLIAFLKDVIDGSLRYQRPDGLFHNLVDQPESFVETNMAQMLAYSIFVAVDHKWLDTSYLTAAEWMRQAAHKKVDAYGFVQGACGAPQFNSSGVSTEAQAFFLMMEAAAARHGKH
jgi:rhamnogalacturonyl hydrolase YesR